MPGQIIISVASCSYLVTVELLRRQIALTFNCVEVAATLPNVIVILILV
jgi:hypothetical protein